MINYNLLKTLNILYICNDIEFKKDFLKMIDSLFNTIVYANNSIDIKNIFKDKNSSSMIDIVISDIEISNNSIEILEIVKKEDSNLPIILISDNIEAETLLKAIKYKVSDYLPKTLKRKELIDSIQKVCQSRYSDKFRIEMEDDLEDLIRAINDVALVSKTDLNGNITFANNHFCETAGFFKDEIIGKTHELISDKKTDLTQEKQLWKDIKLGKIWEGKKRFVSKTNEVFFGYLSVIPIFNPINNSIKEYMWISFLSTEEELEQNEFKKKVAQSINTSRRINTEAREEIDRLMKELEKCKNYDLVKVSLIEEKRKTFKLINQISKNKKDIKDKEKEISKIIEKKEIDFKNKSIGYLLEELDTQIEILEKLKEEKK